MSKNLGYVYVLHFDRPLKHAKHYVGWSKDHPLKPNGRIDKHRKGQGSALTKALFQAEIGFEVSIIWEGVCRNFERRKKNSGGASRYCPICKDSKIKRPNNSNT